MKATELMIGDWVFIDHCSNRLEPCFGQVKGIDKNGEDVYTTDGMVDISLLKPIPLTSEILEQNGFGRVPQPGCFNPYHWKLEKRDEDGELLYRIEAYNTPFRGMFIQINNPSDCASISFCKQIEHVHELQNALRLCGIDTEIIIKED